jgi:hypothetical protein
MALALTFVQSNNGETLTVTDASTDTPDYTGLTLTIGLKDGTAYSIDDVIGITQVGDSIEVTADDVGQTANTAFLDGVYVVTYDATNETQVQYNVLLDYNVKLCVYDLLRQLPDIHASATISTNKQVERVNFMYTYLKALEYSAACGQVNEIETILASLQNLCLNPGISECYCN